MGQFKWKIIHIFLASTKSDDMCRNMIQLAEIISGTFVEHNVFDECRVMSESLFARGPYSSSHSAEITYLLFHFNLYHQV